jgi:hypothetical protein
MLKSGHKTDLTNLSYIINEEIIVHKSDLKSVGNVIFYGSAGFLYSVILLLSECKK